MEEEGERGWKIENLIAVGGVEEILFDTLK